MSSDTEKRWAQFIAELMASQKLNQDQFAAVTGLSHSQISRWRRGMGGVRMESVQRVVDAFGLNRDEVMALAGYGDNTSPSTVDGVDPLMAALLDADRKDVHETLGATDPAAWRLILEASKIARDAAAKAWRTATDQQISTTPPQDISNPPPSSTRGGQRGKPGPNTDFTPRFPLDADDEQFANRWGGGLPGLVPAWGNG